MVLQFPCQVVITENNADMLYGAKVHLIISVLITTKQIILLLVGLLLQKLIKTQALFLEMLVILL